MFKTVVMRTKWFIWPTLVLLVIALVAIWAADNWLESPAGKARLESAVADALNMPVRLAGDFNISFWPSVGISGNKLEIGGPPMNAAGGAAAGGPWLQCDSYHVSVALWPLVQGHLIVLAVRAAGGEIDSSRFSAMPPNSPAGPQQPLRLPQIDLLQLENFQISIAGNEKLFVLLHRLRVSDFQVETATPLLLEFSIIGSSESIAQLEIESSFTLDGQASLLIVEMSRLDIQTAGRQVKEGSGSATWDRAQETIEAYLEGQDPDFGRISVSGSISTATQAGVAGMEVRRAFHDEALVAQMAFKPMPGGMELAGVQIESADQRISGRGCLRTGVDASLHLDLEAPIIDFDQLQSWVPADGGSSSGFDLAQLDVPLDLHIRLSVDEVRSGKVVARRVQMGTGGPPDCSFMPE